MKLTQSGFRSYIIGGELKFSTEAVVGTDAVESLKKYNFTKCFIGTNGIDTERGFTTPDIDESMVKTTAIDQSYVSYILADHTKFGIITSVSFADIQKACAETAAENTLNQFIEMFSAVDDELTQQRATDVSDIKKRLLRILLGIEEIDLGSLPPGTIIVTKDLTPSMTTEIKKENINGIITEKGGITSHSAILSRALEIPAVLSVPEITKILKDGDSVIIDGKEGDVISEPTEADKQKYEKARVDFLKEKEYLNTFIGKDTMTEDGYHKEVFCNIGTPKDAVTAVQKDGEGIGLFRTEFLFMVFHDIQSV